MAAKKGHNISHFHVTLLVLAGAILVVLLAQYMNQQVTVGSNAAEIYGKKPTGGQKPTGGSKPSSSPRYPTSQPR